MAVTAELAWLFWDVDPTTIDLERHRDYVVERVMTPIRRGRGAGPHLECSSGLLGPAVLKKRGTGAAWREAGAAVKPAAQHQVAAPRAVASELSRSTPSRSGSAS